MNNNQIENNLIDLIDYKVDYKKEFFKYYHFVKWFILSVISFLIIAFIYLRYCDYLYFIDAKIESQYKMIGEGSVSGTVSAKKYWIDRHYLEWERTLEVTPFNNTLSQHQKFTATVLRKQ